MLEKRPIFSFLLNIGTGCTQMMLSPLVEAFRKHLETFLNDRLEGSLLGKGRLN